MKGANMKSSYLHLLIVIILISITLMGCGKDGKDGAAFLSFSWSSTIDWYQDDNSSTPSTIFVNTNYSTPPGTYNFQYRCSDAYTYKVFTGSYTITINKGEKGSFLTSGDDGKNKNFSIYLGWYGPSVSVNKLSKTMAPSEEFTPQKKINKGIYSPPKDCAGPWTTQEIDDGNISITLRYRIVK